MVRCDGKSPNFPKIQCRRYPLSVLFHMQKPQLVPGRRLLENKAEGEQSRKKEKKPLKKLKCPVFAAPWLITTSGPFPILLRPDPAWADDAIGACSIQRVPASFRREPEICQTTFFFFWNPL